MGQIFNPTLDKYWRFVVQATWQNDGDDFELPLGDIESAGGTPTFEDIERKTREYPFKTTAAIDTIGSEFAINLVVFSLLRHVAQAMWMDNSGDLVIQAAATNLTKTFLNVRKGAIYNLGKENVTINSADDGETVNPINFLEDDHYRLHSETGRMEIKNVPAGAEKLVVDFDAAAIAEIDDVAVYGGMSSPGKSGTLRFYGISNIGQNFVIEFWRCRIRPSGEIAFQGADDYSSAALEVRVFADGTKPEKFRYFRVRELKS